MFYVSRTDFLYEDMAEINWVDILNTRKCDIVLLLCITYENVPWNVPLNVPRYIVPCDVPW